MDLLEVDRILACVGPSFENQDLRFFLLREGNSSVGVKSIARNSGRVKLTESALVLSVGQNGKSFLADLEYLGNFPWT